MAVLHVFADESCTTAHRHMVFGAIAIDAADHSNLDEAFSIIRFDESLTRELKWAKVSRSMLDKYVRFLDLFFKFVQSDKIHFHAMHVDTATFQHRKFSGGDEEIGFNKLIYQLLLHRIGKLYGSQYEIEVFLDERTHIRDPDEMTAMLNADLARRWGNNRKPFRFVRFVDSKKYDLMQLTDILIGAIGYRKNGQHQKQDAAKHKCELALHIGRNAVRVERRGLASKRAHRFTLWNFRYKSTPT